MSNNKKVTADEIRATKARYGLLSIHDTDDPTKCVLSQPRAVLVMCREKFVATGDAAMVVTCDSGIEALTMLIKDNFKVTN